MTKLYSLFAGTTIDTAVKAVELNQIVVNENGTQYVVVKIYELDKSYQYQILNIRELTSFRTQIIEPLSQKFGIGTYYDDKNPQFLTDEEVAELVRKMQDKTRLEAEIAEKKRIEREAVKDIGRDWLNNNLPINAKAMIVAYKEGCDYDPGLDYQNYSKVNYQILGFSQTEKNSVQELRKYAPLFNGTQYLESENPNDIHNNSKYDFYIGYFNDWMIKKIVIQDRTKFIETWAYTAGNNENIHVKVDQLTATSITTNINTDNLNFEIVDYSEKAIALFGDTKEIKDLLKAMGGKFNPRLTHNNEKQAGWIFSKSKKDELETILTLNQ